MSPGPLAELASWKEIANYLGVSVKTAQLREQNRGLPVRRLPGGRGRVWAEAAELESWKRSNAVEVSLSPVKKRVSTRVALAVGLIVIVAIMMASLFMAKPAQPALVEVEAQGFAVKDTNGNHLWRYSSTVPLRQKWYRAEEKRGLAWVGDLNGDGAAEVLFSPQTQDSVAGWMLLCFDRSGAERWRFLPGKPVKSKGGETFHPPYGVTSVLVLPADETGQRRIVVNSIHHLYYPSQVALLDHRGNLIREYWHSGQLHQSLRYSAGRRPLVLVAGVRNSMNEATFLALDPDSFGGASREPEPFQLEGGPPIGETARFTFPRTCINRAFQPMNVANGFSEDAGGITVHVNELDVPPGYPEILYHFTKRLEFLSAVPGSSFVGEHGRLHAAKKIDHELSPAEIASLRPARIH